VREHAEVATLSRRDDFDPTGANNDRGRPRARHGIGLHDKPRCAELHKDGRRCQLVRGHDGQRVLREITIIRSITAHLSASSPA
jgi:hypothetical protein